MPAKCKDCDGPVENPHLKRCDACDAENNRKHSPGWKPLDAERV
ncbi:MAG: hypothetical protein OXI27_08420 [Thaumarchaeota archaeon]|nr:hypothetical protein [Nitrososphaerota archaeon]